MTGRRLSRRVFLQAMAASGIAAAGLARGAAGAVRRLDPPQHAPAQQILGDRIGDLALALSYDVDAIFRFVADSIRYEPYVGILRGADGTLAARAGNSADQATLLAAILDASLIPYRFAIGRLNDKTADSLLAGATGDAESLEMASLAALAGTLPGIPPSATALEPETQAAADRAAESADRVVAWAQEQVASTISSIETALRSAGVELPRDFTQVPIREVDQHVWVQASQGPDWIDLDPSLPTNAPGQAVTTATESVETLPDELRHVIEFAVVGEHLSGDVLSTESLLRVWAYADRLAGLPITFLNAEASAIEQFGEAVTPIDGVKSYVPTIAIGEEGFGGAPIRFGRAGALEGDFLTGESLFAGGVSTGETTAEWLEATITSPDQEPVVVRRAIFDRFGPAARSAGLPDTGALTPAEEITLADGSKEILPALASTWLTVNTGLPDRAAPVMNETDDDTGVGAVLAFGQHVFRELGDLVLGLPLGTRSFADAPNLVAYAVGPKQGTDGVVRVEAAIDIWHRSHGTMPVAGAAVQAPPATLAGVLDHVVERVIGGDVVDQDGGRPVSVGAVFDAARTEGIGFRVLRSPQDVAVLEYHADAQAVLRATLSDGWLAVAPERPVTVGEEDRVGWWLVDPASGRVVDQLDDGRGAINEYGITLTPGQLARQHALKKLARDCLGGTAIAAAALLNAYAGAYIATTQTHRKGAAWVAFGNGASAAGSGMAAYEPLKFCVKAALS